MGVAGVSTKGSPARTFEDLGVWRKAHQFVLAVYKLTREFPKQETYGLVSRRAGTSRRLDCSEHSRRISQAG